MTSNKTLTVSIIIPVYNEADYIEACLEAIYKQTVEPLEVIIVDNKSTDQTVKLASKFKDKINNLRLLNEKKQGALYARTTGFNAAKGDIIGRIDADSRIEPGWVERLQDNFCDKELMAVTGSSNWYDMPFSPLNHWVEDFFKHTLFRYEKNFPFLFGANMAIRRTAWDSIRPGLCHKEYIFEDADIAIHLFKDKQKLLYDIKLRSGVSARRYNDSFKKFVHYIRLQDVTYRQHGIRTWGSAVSIIGYMIGFIILKPLALSYDLNKNKFSIKKLFTNPNKPRPHPFE